MFNLTYCGFEFFLGSSSTDGSTYFSTLSISFFPDMARVEMRGIKTCSKDNCMYTLLGRSHVPGGATDYRFDGSLWK